MNVIQNKTFDMERALYGSRNITVQDCSFDGPADGESAFKECSHVRTERCFFNLRYPFWHDHELEIHDSEMTELCRAALWYSDHITITGTKLHGIKALRECAEVKMKGCDIISPEFGWSVRGIEMEDCTAESEYFMMRSDHLHFKNVRMKGKYSFQYIEDSVFENCVFDNTYVSFEGASGDCYAYNVKFVNCIFKGTLGNGGAMVSFDDYVYGDAVFENCSFDVTANGNATSAICADIYPDYVSGNDLNITLSNVTFTGTSKEDYFGKKTPVMLKISAVGIDNVNVTEQGVCAYVTDGEQVNYDGTAK